MANKLNDQRLFDYINAIGDCCGYNGLFVFDNTGPGSDGGKSYRCFLKGGICFEIHKEKDDNGNWDYWLDIEWEGPFGAAESTDIIATLYMIGHDVPKLEVA